MAEPDKLNIDSIIQRLLEGENFSAHLLFIDCCSQMKLAKSVNTFIYVFVLNLCRVTEKLEAYFLSRKEPGKWSELAVASQPV